MKTEFEIYEEKGVRYVHQKHTAYIRDFKTEKDKDGNEYFYLMNPYYKYSKSKSKFRNDMDSDYGDYPNLAFQMVREGWADTIIGYSGIFSGGIFGVPILYAVVYVDRAVGEQKRKEFDDTWDKNLLGFKWSIKYYTGGFSSSPIRDSDFNIIKYDTEDEVKNLIARVNKELEVVNKKLEELASDKSKEKEYDEYIKYILHRKTDDATFDTLVFDGIKDPESDHEYVFKLYPCSIPIFKDQEESK